MASGNTDALLSPWWALMHGWWPVFHLAGHNLDRHTKYPSVEPHGDYNPAGAWFTMVAYMGKNAHEDLAAPNTQTRQSTWVPPVQRSQTVTHRPHPAHQHILTSLLSRVHSEYMQHLSAFFSFPTFIHHLPLPSG